MEFDSKEELYFSWYLEELKDIGVISSYLRPEPIELSEKLSLPITVYSKVQKKPSIKDKFILHPHKYTSDFQVTWNITSPNFVKLFPPHLMSENCYQSELLEGIYCQEQEDGFITSIIEVKPKRDSNNMIRLFSINRKWVYHSTGILVSLATVPTIFAKTFTPSRYLFTDKTAKPRTIKFQTKLLNEFLC